MGGLLDYTVSFLGQVIVISRPRSLTILTLVVLCQMGLEVNSRKSEAHFLATSGAQERLLFARPSIRLLQVCLELSIFINLAQISFRSHLGHF